MGRADSAAEPKNGLMKHLSAYCLGVSQAHLCALLLLVSSGDANAKRLAGSADSRHAAVATPTSVTELEALFTPFLEHKVGHSLSTYRPRGPGPTFADFLGIARHWDQLSNGFKGLYKRATEIPESFVSYTSPGGHFDVYYILPGMDTACESDAVAPSDAYSFGDGSNWRVRIDTSNSVPDYIDEVAWALDSAWSMEIDRFGFVLPYARSDDPDRTQRYRVQVCDPGGGVYGWTIPLGSLIDKTGYASYIELRNSWDSDEWETGEIINYRSHPEKAIRITAAHEFFHSIQYAMTRHELDDFPITWIEGTAVLMEELAFDYVNDYTQYLDKFFHFPTRPMLDRFGDGITEYKNVLITKWLYEKALGNPRIDFIKRMFDRNYASAQPFHANLSGTSQDFGLSWPRLLGRFFAESYFTGDRANEQYFVVDAPILDEWTWHDDAFAADTILTKPVQPSAMNMFSIRRTDTYTDTLFVAFSGEGFSGSSEWDVHVILDRNDTDSDTLTHLPVLPGDTTALYAVPNWHDYAAAMVVVTNAAETGTREANVRFSRSRNASPLPTYSDSALAIYPNPVRKRWQQGVAFTLPDMRAVSIYTLGGKRLATLLPGKGDVADSLTWNLANTRGEPIVPATYFAIISYQSEQSQDVKHHKRKILVLP